VGHSMGGLVVAAFACERQPDIAGAVLSGAALRVAEVPSGIQLAVLRGLRLLAPRLAMQRPVDPDALSRDPEVGRAYLEDPLVFGELTLSLAAGLFDAAQRTRTAGARAAVPMLVLHGASDPLCLPSGSRDFYRGLAVAGSELKLYPELRHEIFNEPERERVLADVLDWMRKREASP
jgi:alpha-beta hydrolase superfamily lysophospholipase